MSIIGGFYTLLGSAIFFTSKGTSSVFTEVDNSLAKAWNAENTSIQIESRLEEILSRPDKLILIGDRIVAYRKRMGNNVRDSEQPCWQRVNQYSDNIVDKVGWWNGFNRRELLVMAMATYGYTTSFRKFYLNPVLQKQVAQANMKRGW